MLSHFELYVVAMKESGADCSAVTAFQQRLEGGRSAYTALREARVPAAAREFVNQTLDVLEADRPYAVASVFAAGREQIIPAMFSKLVTTLTDSSPGRLEAFKLYLERHIELDQREHGPLASEMLKTLCGSDRSKWEEATHAATSALKARRRLWDTILEEVETL